MTAMVDPYIGFESYQQALNDEIIHPKKCKVHTSLKVLFDDVPDGKRITYALTEGKTVKATVVFAPNGFFEGRPCFQVGYAVNNDFRQKGIAKEVLRMSIEELTHGFSRSIPSFFIEAVVSPSNLASLRIAENVIGGTRDEIVDRLSGEKAIRFTTKAGLI